MNITICDLCREETTWRNNTLIPEPHRREVEVQSAEGTPAFVKPGAVLRFEIRVYIDEANVDDFYVPDLCGTCMNALIAEHLDNAIQHGWKC